MTISLLFGVHAHQPVGNPPAILEEAHARCYRPFLETLYRYPEFRFSAHFSGWLLDYLFERHPADMEQLKQMVARGQIEMFGAGWSEPVLSAVPHRDRLGQLAATAQQFERYFGQRPRGGWLTERVWESSVVTALVQSGIRYVTVDDYHFLCAGKRADELDGYYTTEEDGATLDVFPISEALRYKLPFSLAPEALAFIGHLADQGRAAAVYFDDIEKFGIWPDTWDWVYGKGWLEQFITGVLATPRVRTATYGEFHAGARTRGIVYLPTTSYIEMNEYTLPPAAARTYAALVREHRDAHRYDETKAFLRGGIWRHFFMRYPEANWMHKRMLALSGRLADLAPAQRTKAMSTALYRAQANDAYWHGLFGGIYLPHLRRAVYRNLLELETALDAVAPRPAVAQWDLDHDGARELFLHNAALQVVARDDGLAAIHEFDSYALWQNFADTLRRGREHYYDQIERGEGRGYAGGDSDSGIASAHDRVRFRHAISPDDIVPDELPRVLFCDRIVAADGAITLINRYALESIESVPPSLVFCAQAGGGVVRKRYELAGAQLSVGYEIKGLAGATFASELNVSLPSCDGYSGRYILANGDMPCGFGQELAQDALGLITLDDRELGGALVLTAEPPAALRARPHFTVSQSEAGFEKIMQAATLTLNWRVASAHAALRITLEVVSLPAPPNTNN
jgi:4-alpha-glucanotransferase